MFNTFVTGLGYVEYTFSISSTPIGSEEIPAVQDVLFVKLSSSNKPASFQIRTS